MRTSGLIHTAKGAWAALSHLALPPVVYAAGLSVGAWHLAGLGRVPPVQLVLFVACASLGVYLLDRAKLPGSPIDEADRSAHPRRVAFIEPRLAFVRTLAFAALSAAAIVGWAWSPALVVLPLLGAVGVWIYSGVGRPGHRAKDALVLKLMLIALGLVVLITECAWAGGARGQSLGLAGLWAAAATVADASLCDLDHAAADRAAGTRTIAVVFGARATWAFAIALHLAAGGIAVATRLDGVGIAWAAGQLCVTAALAPLSQYRSVRDLVDLRMGVLAILIATAWPTAAR